MEAAEKVRRLLAEKTDVVRFDIGEPDFDTPRHISEAGTEAISKGFTHYTSPRGIPELRDALVHDLRQRNGLEAGTDQLVFYPGSKFAIFSVFSLLCEEGDEVIIEDPLWPTYASILEFLRAVPLRVQNWNEIEATSSVEGMISKITSKTKAVLVNSPSNPTGSTVPEREIARLLEECDKRGIPLILDRIYSALSYDGENSKVPAYDLEDGNLIIVSGFSKEFAMTGWRLGYSVASKNFTKLLCDFQENTTSCPASFVQKAAVAALTGPREWQTKMNSEYRERRDLMLQGIGQIPGWKCAPPPGAFYCFPSIPSSDSVSYSKKLLEEKYVSLIAGAHFGPSGEGHLRLSYTTSKDRIVEGMKRIKEFASEHE